MKHCNESVRWKVAVIGLGAIGSHLVGLVARMPSLGSLALIDYDSYEESNVFSQDVLPADIGRPKAEVQAARVSLLRPDVEVEALPKRVQEIPLGILRRADVVLAALDSRVSRQYVATWCWRLRTALVDSGVMAQGLMARVVTYVPSSGWPCLLCSYTAEDYELLEQVYTCSSNSTVAATNSPAYLGAAAASLQAAACEAFLRRDTGAFRPGRQILLDMANHSVLLTDYVKNNDCRSDHRMWDVGEISRSVLGLTLREVFAELALACNLPQPVQFGIAGRHFVSRLNCTVCGNQQIPLALSNSLTEVQIMCTCGADVVAPGFGRSAWVRPEDYGEADLSMTLGDLGVCLGDIITVKTASGPHYLEISAQEDE